MMAMVTLSACVVPIDTQSLLIPRFQRSEIVGFIAGFGTSLAAVPNLLAMLRRRSSTGTNIKMTAIMAVFQLLWVLYGLLVVSRPVVLWNMLAAVMNFTCLAIFFYFRRRWRWNGLRGYRFR